MSVTSDSVVRNTRSTGWQVLTTAAGVILAAAIIYLAAVVGGYVDAQSRPLYVVLIPLVVIGALVVAWRIIRDARPEGFYIAATAGAVIAVVATALATWFNALATNLAVEAAKAVGSRQAAAAIGKTRDAAQRLEWSEVAVVIGVSALIFLATVVAATMAVPDGRKVVRTGSVEKLQLATAGAALLTIAVCGWLLLRL